MGFIVFALLIALVGRGPARAEPNLGMLHDLRSTLADERRASDQEKIKACDDLAAMKYQAWPAVPELVALLSRRGVLSLHALKALKATNPAKSSPNSPGGFPPPSPALRAAAADALVAMADRADLIVPQMEELLLTGKEDGLEMACSVSGRARADGIRCAPVFAGGNPHSKYRHACLRHRGRPRGRAGPGPASFVFIAKLHGNIFDAREAADGLGKMGPAGQQRWPCPIFWPSPNRMIPICILLRLPMPWDGLGRPLPRVRPGPDRSSRREADR